MNPNSLSVSSVKFLAFALLLGSSACSSKSTLQHTVDAAKDFATQADSSGTGGGNAGASGSDGAVRLGGGGSGGNQDSIPGDLGIVCSGQIVAFPAPVMLATTIDCAATSKVSIAARAAADTMYIAFTTNGVPVDHLRLASIGPTAVAVEDTGIAAGAAFVMVDAADLPRIAAGGLANGGTGYFVRSGLTWTPEMVSPVPTASSDLYIPWGARLASNGQPVILYAGPSTTSPTLQLAARTPAGIWSTTSIAASEALPANLVIDSSGRSRVLFQQPAPPPALGPALVDMPLGLVGQRIGAMWSTSYDLEAAPGLGGLVGVASVGRDTIGLIFSDGQTAAKQVAIPLTPLMAGACSCVSGNCKLDGTTNAVALASTNDGAFWLAYAIDHIDRDITATTDGTVGPLGQKCQSAITADRSTQEIVLVRLTADAASTPTIKWRLSVALDSVLHLALAARDSRLLLAFSDGTIRTFTFDWAKL
jgi:hypothetical protein